MKFSIKLKIVALGAVLSLVVTSAAVVFGNFEYRRRGENSVINTIDNWFDNIDDDLTEDPTNNKYLSAISVGVDYIIQQYTENPEEPSADLSLEETKNFYKTIYTWCYAIEGFGMYPMSEEEREFRANYEEYTYLLVDTKSATKGLTAYTAFVYDNKLFYLADEFSYLKIISPEMHFPGERINNFNGEFVQKGNYLNCNFDGKMNRVYPVKHNGETLAYIFVEYDFNEVKEDTNSLVRMEAIVLSIASLVMIVAYALGAHLWFLKNVSKLNRLTSEFTNELSKGKEPKMIDPKIKTHDEIRELSNSFVALEQGIINYIDVIKKETKEKERTNAELSVATGIQLSALPSCVYDDEQATIRTFIKSAKEVGGDFYDYFYLDDNRLAIVISDVSGKGIPAALFMMKSKELIKSAMRSNKTIVEAAKEVNETLCRNNEEQLFVTSFLGVIDFKNKVINYVNAGHEKPYILSKGKVIKLDGNSNFVMGGVEGFEYVQESHAFNKGDMIFLFTDGLNESINKDEEEFSYSRIEETLKKSKDLSLDKTIDAMHDALVEFVGEEEQFDDVTMLLVKYREDELHLSYDRKDYDIIPDIVDRFNEAFGYLPNETKGSVGIIIDELVNNLVSYEKREDLKIKVDFKVIKNDLEVIVSSNGADYNPFASHKEKYAEGFDPEMKEGGFGLSLIKNFAKSYDYTYKKDNASVKIVVSFVK